MSAAAQSSGTDSGAVVYVYGVARGDALANDVSPPVEGIIPGVPVELLPVGNLAVIMSRTSKDAFAPSDAEANDASDWATERALAHHRVLANLAAFCTIAPVKFGALCRGLDDVLALFVRSASAFERALDRVEGAQEWGVKLFADAEACRAAADADSTVMALGAEVAAAAPGKAFFLRKKLQAAIEDAIGGVLNRLAESVHCEIGAKAREAAPGRTGGPRDGQTSVLILDCAYLVDRSREAEFRQTLADLASTLDAQGSTLTLTGPWPPYSFAAIDTGGTADERR